MRDIILLVDDEASVRLTVSEWLTSANLDCDILTAGDAESALKLANEHAIDLAILDWNLGSGDDGLQLLHDLSAFHPDIVAIMITGFANLATPLDAMRMGVRDYLDKNHDFSKEALAKSVRKQLDLIRPAKQMRHLHQTLVGFRGAVEQVLPLVQSTAALNDPVPLPDAIRALVRFLMQVTQARDGVLLVRQFDAAKQPAEVCRVYDSEGTPLGSPTVPFARSVAGGAAGLGQPSVINDLKTALAGSLELQAFESKHSNVLAVPMTIASGSQVVAELFDKPTGFTADDQRIASSAADLGADLLRQAMGQKRAHQMLFDAVAAALKMSEQMTASVKGERKTPSTPDAVLTQLREGLRGTTGDSATADATLQLADAIRTLSAKYGPPAVMHCLTLIREVHSLLDSVTQG